MHFRRKTVHSVSHDIGMTTENTAHKSTLMAVTLAWSSAGSAGNLFNAAMRHLPNHGSRQSGRTHDSEDVLRSSLTPHNELCATSAGDGARPHRNQLLL